MNLAGDSSVFVSSLFPQETWHHLAFSFVNDVLAGVHQVAVPCTVLTEVICAGCGRCTQYGLDRKLVMDFGRRLKACPYIKWKTVDFAFANEAAMCGRMYGLRGMDALVASTACYYGVPLLTLDNEFRILEPSVYVIKLDELRSFGI